MIEVHITDMKRFRRCRRKWDWASPLREGLEPDGLRPRLWLGRGVHHALDVFYVTGRDPVEVFDEWVEEQREEWQNE